MKASFNSLFVFPVLFILLSITGTSLFMPIAKASSQQAYQDYLYQFDVYRQNYTDFKVAKNEYEKFKSLTSQSDALDKTRIMLSQRDQLLRAYLLLLNEKLNEDQGLESSQKQLYRTLLNNEIIFLNNHSTLVTAIGSLEDADQTSKKLESHYNVLQASLRQTIGGIALGELAIRAKAYDIALADAKALINTYRGTFIPEKQSTLDRWVLQISNTRSLYQQKVDEIAQNISQFQNADVGEQDRRFQRINKSVGEARQYLLDGSGYIRELVEALRFQN